MKVQNCYICKEEFCNVVKKNIVKLEIIVIIQEYRAEYRDPAHSICNLKYCVPKNILKFS